jgi:chitin disaccharide deacetylase
MRRKAILTILLSIITLGFALNAPAQDSKAVPRLLIRVDDMGSTHSANATNLKCIEAGIIQDVQLMVVGPWFPEAARILQSHKDIEVGSHFTITSEWENCKWRPLTHCPSLMEKAIEKLGIELVGYGDVVNVDLTPKKY